MIFSYRYEGGGKFFQNCTENGLWRKIGLKLKIYFYDFSIYFFSLIIISNVFLVE